MHRGEMPLFIVRYGAAAIRIVTPRGGGSLTFPWRLQQTPGWDQFSGKGRGLLFLGRVRYEELTLPKLTCLLEVLDSRLEGTKPCSLPSPSCIRPLCLME